MINRIKQWDLKNFNVSDRSIMSLTFVVALMALIIAIPGGTNCASADTCTVSSTANFTGNVALKSNTNYSATLQHSLAANVIANFEDPENWGNIYNYLFDIDKGRTIQKGKIRKSQNRLTLDNRQPLAVWRRNASTTKCWVNVTHTHTRIAS